MRDLIEVVLFVLFCAFLFCSSCKGTISFHVNEQYYDYSYNWSIDQSPVISINRISHNDGR